MGERSKNFEEDRFLHSAWLDTPIGLMLAIADEKHLYLLELEGRRGLENEIERLRLSTNSTIIPGHSTPIVSIEKELKDYFAGYLRFFKTPLLLTGTPFQKLAWKALLEIPFGETKSYAEQAINVGKPAAYRAVANANGANQLAIVIPCHRVINSNGELGGYAGGIQHKKWLIDHEKHYS